MKGQILFNQARFMKTAIAPEGYPKEPLPHIAVVGRSNVGKSSLLNCLFQRKGLAKISSTPGKTQALQFFNVADRLIVADLPGYGYSKVSQKISSSWGPMIETYLTQNDKLENVIALIDIRHDPSVQDEQFIEWARAKNLPLTLVLTKADKLSKNKCAQQAAHLAKQLRLEIAPIVTSAESKMGRAALIHHILEALL